jgi:hypothetical protein
MEEKEKSSIIEFTTITGQIIAIDTSNEACSRFELILKPDVPIKACHGDRFRDGFNRQGSVVGVAQATDSDKKVLWGKLDEDDGRVRYWSDPAWDLVKI